MLKVNELTVTYGPHRALTDVSIHADEGEIVVVIGANGAGKSTLLNTIVGLIKPIKGEIKFKGERIDPLPPYKIVEKGVSLVPEGRRVFPKLTVLENLELGAYTKRARQKKNENLEFVFKLFPRLKERKHQKAGTLSGGERQMLAIGRALMSDPELLLLDEPSLGLAPKIVLEIFNVLKELKKYGITILLVEQHAYKALTIADRGYVLENGRITLSGTGQELLNNEYVKSAYLGI